MDERTADGEINETPAPEPDEGSDLVDVQSGAGTGAPPMTVEVLQAEVARLTGEAERNWQQFLRAAADLENYRKQAARQREEAVAATRRVMFGIILTVVDTLERALNHADAAGNGSAGAITDGIRLAHRQVLDTLKTMGVRPMESVGQFFDPRVHEAIDAVAAPEGIEPGVIVGEIQRGYLIGEEVLRPARVRVAQ
jgi:molecular chaperone GrpE